MRTRRRTACLLALLLIVAGALVVVPAAQATTANMLYDAKKVGAAGATLTVTSTSFRMEQVALRANGFAGTGSYEAGTFALLTCKLAGYSRTYPYPTWGRTINLHLSRGVVQTTHLPPLRLACPGGDTISAVRATVRLRPVYGIVPAVAVLRSS